MIIFIGVVSEIQAIKRIRIARFKVLDKSHRVKDSDVLLPEESKVPPSNYDKSFPIISYLTLKNPQIVRRTPSIIAHHDYTIITA